MFLPPQISRAILFETLSWWRISMSVRFLQQIFHNFPRVVYVGKKLACTWSSMTPNPAVSICRDSDVPPCNTLCVRYPTCECNLWYPRFQLSSRIFERNHPSSFENDWYLHLYIHFFSVVLPLPCCTVKSCHARYLAAQYLLPYQIWNQSIAVSSRWTFSFFYYWMIVL